MLNPRQRGQIWDSTLRPIISCCTGGTESFPVGAQLKFRLACTSPFIQRVFIWLYIGFPECISITGDLCSFEVELNRRRLAMLWSRLLLNFASIWRRRLKSGSESAFRWTTYFLFLQPRSLLDFFCELYWCPLLLFERKSCHCPSYPFHDGRVLWLASLTVFFLLITLLLVSLFIVLSYR